MKQLKYRSFFSGKYIGSFFNGVFHGEGTLYVDGGRFYGDWDNGRLISGSFIYDDELTYQGDDKGWSYCTKEDPRFFSEICEGIDSEGPLKYPTPNPAPPVLPDGCYDMISGYYDPKKHSIKAYGTDEEIRRPDQDEKNWMTENCRYQAPAEKA